MRLTTICEKTAGTRYVFQSTTRKASGSTRVLTTFPTTPRRWCIHSRPSLRLVLAQEASLRLHPANREREAVLDKAARLPGVQRSRLAGVRGFWITKPRRSPGTRDSVRIGRPTQENSCSSSNSKSHVAKIPVMGMVTGFTCYFIGFPDNVSLTQ